MQLLIVHLSDMHLKCSSTIDNCIAEKICNIIAHDSIGIEHILFLITGDIANSGSSNEYLAAIDFFSTLSSSCKPKKTYIAMCPGNHDKNLSANEEANDRAVDKIIALRKISDEEFIFLDTYFKDYRAFSDLVDAENDSRCISNDFLTTYKIQIDGKIITIDSFNTTLCAKRHCTHSSLFMPLERIPKKQSGDISICMMHTTENWIKHSDRKAYRDSITQTYDFVFTGHEHSGYNYRVENNNDNSIIMIEGGALNPHEADEAPEFNTVVINEQCKTALIKRYVFNFELKFFEEKDSNGFPYGGSAQSVHICNKAVSLTKDTTIDMQDSGAPYRHPTITNLKLDNLFIYPDVKKFKYSAKKGMLEPHIYSMGDIDCTTGMYIFFGAEKSGKSHCCRKIFSTSMTNGNIPLLIKLSDKVNIHSINDIEKEITRTAKKTYADINIDAFVQTSSSRKNIIIDDFHVLKINNQRKYQILSSLTDRYPNICIFSDESAQFDTLLYSKETGRNFHDVFEVYNIMPFGHQKRDELIRKWHKNDLPYDEDPILLERKIEASRAVLNTVVKNGFVPSYPFFLYTALSSFTIPNIDTKIEESTYGHFFTTLLNIAIIEISPKGDQNDLYFNYLTEFAFRLFSQNSSYMTKDEYWEFHHWYVEEFSLSQEYTDMFEKLKGAKLLQERDDIVFFRYKYFYFYFLAKYLTSSLYSDETKKTIESFCSMLHQEIASNVLMFLIHLSKDQSIISALINKAQETLRESQESDLKNGAGFIDALISDLPELVYNTEEDHAEEKKKTLAMVDRIDHLPSNDKYSGDSIKPLNKDVLDVSQESNFDPNKLFDAFKTVEIIGQIMRNYHGSLRTPFKDSLCKEAYSLTLRSIDYFFEALATERDGLIDELTKVLEKISPDRKEKRELAARKFLFSIASMVAYCFITKCASDLGSSDLSVTFKRVLAEYEANDNIAVRLIDIAIKLAHQIPSPTEDVKRLSQKTANSNIGRTILQWLTYNHMRIYQLPIDTRQKLCDATNIALKSTGILPRSGLQ